VAVVDGLHISLYYFTFYFLFQLSSIYHTFYSAEYLGQLETHIRTPKRYEDQWINLLTPNVNYSGRTAPLTSKFAFYVFIQQVEVLNILNMVYTLRFFSSKCSLFHNSNVFGSCIIHILYTEWAKIKKILRRQKVKDILYYSTSCNLAQYV